MKKIILVYTSKRGSTLQYAQWIAEALADENCTCDLTDFRDIRQYNLHEYDFVIYGGWIRGSGIVDFDRFSKLLDDTLMDKLIVYGVGIALQTAENYAQVWSINIGKIDPKNVHRATLYIFDGAYLPEKIKGFDRILMSIVKKVMLSGQANNASGDAAEMKRRIEDGIDLVKKENINALVKEVGKRLLLS